MKSREQAPAPDDERNTHRHMPGGRMANQVSKPSLELLIRRADGDEQRQLVPLGELGQPELLDELREAAFADSAQPRFAETRGNIVDFWRIAIDWGMEIAPIVAGLGGLPAIAQTAAKIVDRIIAWSTRHRVKVEIPFAGKSITVDAPNREDAIAVIEATLEGLKSHQAPAS
jgi:hypothetical protein